jgi:hypothetical protein
MGQAGLASLYADQADGLLDHCQFFPLVENGGDTVSPVSGGT